MLLGTLTESICMLPIGPSILLFHNKLKQHQETYQETLKKTSKYLQDFIDQKDIGMVVQWQTKYRIKCFNYYSTMHRPT